MFWRCANEPLSLAGQRVAMAMRGTGVRVESSGVDPESTTAFIPRARMVETLNERRLQPLAFPGRRVTMAMRGAGVRVESRGERPLFYLARLPRGSFLLPTLAVIIICVLAGCAKPQGILFPQLDPPMVWPAPPETPRIQLVGAISDSRDLNAEISAAEIFASALRGPRPPIRFSGPHALAVREGKVLAIADASGAAVHIIDLDRRTHVLVAGFEDEQIQAPVGVTWAGERLFVTDAQRGEILELRSDGAFVRRLAAESLSRPVGIAYAPALDRLYVVDGDEHCVKVLALDGALQKTIGARGPASGEFNFPSHICIDGNRMAVADGGNFRVQILTLDGEPLAGIGQMGDAAGNLALPKGVAFDRDGHLYVVDARFENVQIFNDRGQLLLAFGEEGGRLGQFSLPAGIAIDHSDRIWVADSGNRRVQVFSYLRAAS